MRHEEPSLREHLERALARWASAWHPALKFSAEDIPRLSARLYRLAIQVGGEPQDEEHVTDLEAVEEWGVSMAEQGLGRHFRRLADGLGRAREAPVHWVDAKTSRPVTIGHWESKLDLAEATNADLRRLPGVGSGLAAGIVAFREAGRLTEVDNLLEVPGMGPAKLAALRPLVYLNPPTRPGTLSTPALDAFRHSPGVTSFVDLLLASGGRFTFGGTMSDTGSVIGGAATGDEHASTPALDRAALTEVGRAAVAATADPPARGGGRPISVEEAARLGRLYRRARNVRETQAGLGEAEWAGLVNGSAYRDLCLRLVNGARHEITVVMFFMTYVPGKEHPSNALVESLVEARRRGVRVKVTLDLDRPEDVFGSRLVNREAFDYLTSGGLEVRWDRPERLTHTKLLIIDGRDVLTGSHNWTAGSMYAYDDKSLVIRAPALAEVLGEVARGAAG